MPGKTFIVLVLIALFFGTVLGGCGQKGPLYLPEEDKRSQAEKTD